MGTWSHEPFGNDGANDWAYELEEVADLSLVEEAIDEALRNGVEYLDAGDAEIAIAAIEVIAHLLGKGTQHDTYTEKMEQWVRRVKLKPSPALLGKARQALQRVVSENSELLELWQDSEDIDAWLASIERLRKAIEG